MGLAHDERQRAREAAEGQVPDDVILGALRADVYETLPPGHGREMMLASLWVMEPGDVRELDSFRDRGRMRLQLVMYACAMAYQLNARKDRLDPANPLHDPSDFAEVDAKAAGMAQYLGRVYLTVDPSALREDAAREAQRYAAMSTTEQRHEVLRLLPALGLDPSAVASVGQAWGFDVQGADVQVSVAPTPDTERVDPCSDAT